MSTLKPGEGPSSTEPRRVIDVKYLNKFCEQIKQRKRTCHSNMVSRNAEHLNQLEYERAEVKKTEEMWEQLKLKMEMQKAKKKELNDNIKMTTERMSRENETVFNEQRKIEADLEERNKLVEDNMRSVRQEVYSRAKAMLKEEVEQKHKYEEEEARFRTSASKALRDCQNSWEEKIWDILTKLKEAHTKVHKDKVEVICLQQKTAELEEMSARLREKSVEDEPLRNENNTLKKNLADLELEISALTKNTASLSEKHLRMKKEVTEERKMLKERKANREPQMKLRDKMEKNIRCQEMELEQLRAQLSHLRERLMVTSQDQQRYMQELEHLGDEKYRFKKEQKECMTYIGNPEKLKERVRAFHDNFCTCGLQDYGGSSKRESKRVTIARKREEADSIA